MKIVELVAKQAIKENSKVYLVGGTVRDKFLNYNSKDLDFSVEGDAICFCTAISNRLNGKLIKYERFQTASIILGDFTIDFVTARKEFYEKPGALPIIQKSNIYDDLYRRDFSINAMAINLNNNMELIDLFNGRGDIENKKIRILHNNSFIDDSIRILRCIRLKNRLIFNIEKYTENIMDKCIHEGYLDTVSMSRRINELKLCLNEDNTMSQFKDFYKYGIIYYILDSFVPDEKDLLQILSRLDNLKSKSNCHLYEFEVFLMLLCYLNSNKISNIKKVFLRSKKFYDKIEYVLDDIKNNNYKKYCNNYLNKLFFYLIGLLEMEELLCTD